MTPFQKHKMPPFLSLKWRLGISATKDKGNAANAKKAGGNGIYDLLDSKSGEVRMCKVDMTTEEICRTLTPTYINSIGQYKCLSYVWGNDGHRKDIYVNGVVFSATSSLYAALIDLRRELNGDPIWIDALCINQEDTEEKTQQVPLMADLYRYATEVWIWLGPAQSCGRTGQAQDTTAAVSVHESDIQPGVDLLEQLAQGRHFHELPYFGKCSPSCRCHRELPEKSWRTALDSVAMLMNAEWFERTWTIQEIVLAKRAIAIYNGQYIEWDLIRSAMVAWNRHLNECCTECIFTLSSRDFSAMHRYAGQILDLENAKRSLQRGDDLLRPLIKFRSRKASDHRDKIYGLLGLQDGPRAIPISPNYLVDCSEVFLRFAKSLIDSQKWIVPLHLDLVHNYSDLPSWVPDWTFSTLDPSDYAANRFLASSTYGCANNLAGSAYIIDGRILQLPGVEVDHISQLSCAYRITGDAISQLTLIGKWDEFFRDIQGEPSAYNGLEETRNAYYHALFAGRYHEDLEIRLLKMSDVSHWLSNVTDMSRELREKGPKATLRMNQAMISQAIGSVRRKLFVSSRGYIGVCPDTCRVGDRAFVLCLCRAPIFLRLLDGTGGSDDDRYRAFGHGYIHGLMNGEALGLGIPIKTVSIV